MVKIYDSEINKRDLIQDIELVIFDMDGLMFDTESLIIDCKKRAGDKFGYNITRDIVIQTVGLNYEKTKNLMMEAFGKNFDFDEIYKVSMQYMNEYIIKYGMPYKKGLLELVDFLEEIKILKAVATSSEKKRAQFCLQKAGIDKRFNAIVCGDMIENGKPAPDIFLKASDICNVSPEKCIVLEDSPYGIMAAYRANMLPIMIPDLLQPNNEIEKLLYAKCDSLLDIIDILIEKCSRIICARMSKFGI